MREEEETGPAVVLDETAQKQLAALQWRVNIGRKNFAGIFGLLLGLIPLICAITIAYIAGIMGVSIGIYFVVIATAIVAGTAAIGVFLGRMIFASLEKRIRGIKSGELKPVPAQVNENTWLMSAGGSLTMLPILLKGFVGTDAAGPFMAMAFVAGAVVLVWAAMRATRYQLNLPPEKRREKYALITFPWWVFWIYALFMIALSLFMWK